MKQSIDVDVLTRAQELYDSHETVEPIKQLAEEFNLTTDAVSGRLKRLRKQREDIPNFLNYDKTFLNTTHENLASTTDKFKKYNEHWKLEGDFMVGADPHIPLFSADMITKMMAIALKFNIKNLLIPGDLLDFRKLSSFDKTEIVPDTQTEIEAGRKVLTELFKVFDDIYWFLGNHDNRFLKMLLKFQRLLKAHPEMEDIAELLMGTSTETKKPEELLWAILKHPKLKISAYPHCDINDTWRITHPISYSQNPPFVERKLAAKWRMSVLGCHGHMMCVGYDVSGTDIACQIGGLFDPMKVAYKQFQDTTHPEWNSGFAMIKNNCLYLFNNDPKLTDWNFWLP